MPEFLIRLLIGCLVIWLVDKGLAVFRVGDPPKWVIELITFVLAVLYILFGWVVPIR
jgi:hypothetical protein